MPRASHHALFRLLAAIVLVAAAAGAAVTFREAGAQSAASVVVLEMEGAIGPATADYVSRGIARAAKDGAQLVVLRTDTPGGLDPSMRQIVRAILASPVPVATFVAPSGARAASAGTFILYASHIAATAPGTNLGAATPVRIGGGGLPGTSDPVPKDGKADDAKADPAGGSAMTRKQVNDAAAFIRGLAEMRGRNAAWAEKAVRDAVSLSSREAHAEKVIEYVASGLPDLMKQLDGKEVTVQDQRRTLSTASAPVLTPQADWRTRVLAVVTDPSVALILMMLGVYGLFFEFMSPGFGVAGVLGAIFLLLGLYALHLLPVSYLGLALLILGTVLMISEAFFPGFGILGGGGVVAFVLGAMFLVDTDVPGFSISPLLIAGIAVSSALLLGLVGGLAWKGRNRPVVSGSEQLIGAEGVMLEGAWARVHGEMWRVANPSGLAAGDLVRVRAREGLVLEVEPRKQESKGA